MGPHVPHAEGHLGCFWVCLSWALLCYRNVSSHQCVKPVLPGVFLEWPGKGACWGSEQLSFKKRVLLPLWSGSPVRCPPEGLERNFTWTQGRAGNASWENSSCMSSSYPAATEPDPSGLGHHSILTTKSPIPSPQPLGSLIPNNRNKGLFSLLPETQGHKKAEAQCQEGAVALPACLRTVTGMAHSHHYNSRGPARISEACGEADLPLAPSPWHQWADPFVCWGYSEHALTN